ncbi:sensor histidine kinase [Bacillus sp. JJ722]|uniref:sensor histidine kinase n=1 Tax=Bacillus sp. JJ722 TaxID=3122973 RepID=UPI002FFE22EE
MRGFLKQYRSFIFFYIFSIALIIGIIMLDLFNQNSYVTNGSILYIIILSFILFLLFLCFTYFKERQNYKALHEPVNDINQPIHLFQNSSYHFEEFNRILNVQYGYYIEDISKTKEEKQRYYTFINQWVHQMKTPLSVISLLLQNAKQSNVQSPTLIQNIEEETEKLTKGLELVLHSSRLDLFHEDFKVERLSLSDIVRDCIKEHKSAFIRNQVYPAMDMNDEYFVESDRKWLAFIINQIIANAIKYTAGIGKQIKFYTMKQADEVTLYIHDDGIGIPSQDIKRVFQPFFTGQNGRKYAESTGMGLYLAKRTCDEIGHTISIESEETKGTTIKITFYNVTSL